MDWYCKYQFDKRLAEEVNYCPHRSAEPQQGTILAGNFDGLAWNDDEATLHTAPVCDWQDVTCYACNAFFGQCAIERRLIEEKFGSWEKYEQWLAEREQIRKEAEEREKQLEQERKAQEIRYPMRLTYRNVTYELDEQVDYLLAQAQVGNIPESEFYEALKTAKVVA